MSDSNGKSDGCPAWAVDLIYSLRTFEIQLGNVIPEGEEKGDEYLTRSLGQLLERDEITEESTDTLFRKIVERLADDGFDADQIAGFINARVAPEARLPYCDGKEVQEALSSLLN